LLSQDNRTQIFHQEIKKYGMYWKIYPLSPRGGGCQEGYYLVPSWGKNMRRKKSKSDRTRKVNK
jgi:hypothetical protein